MARAARLALADMRAMQKQMDREEMHGGAFHGAGIVGGGGVPSMGLSQFRGGARRGCGKNCRGCERCMESSSDEEMHGGAWYSSALGALGIGARASAAARAAQAAATNAAAARGTLALRGVSEVVPYSATAASKSIAARLAALSSPSSRALALRTPGTIKPYNPAEAAYRLGATAPGRTMASRLAAMGITPARVAAALAAGVAIGALADYFANEAKNRSGDTGFYNDDVDGPGPGDGDGGDGGPGGIVGPGVDGIPPGLTAAETDMYLRTGNIPYRYIEGSLGRRKQGGKAERRPMSEIMAMLRSKNPKRFGGRTERIEPPAQKPDRRSSRAAIVRKVMKEQGLTLPMASKYVKENGLY